MMRYNDNFHALKSDLFGSSSYSRCFTSEKDFFCSKCNYLSFVIFQQKISALLFPTFIFYFVIFYLSYFGVLFFFLSFELQFIFFCVPLVFHDENQ